MAEELEKLQSKLSFTEEEDESPELGSNSKGSKRTGDELCSDEGSDPQKLI